MIIQFCAILLGLSSLYARDEFTYQQYIGCDFNFQGPIGHFWRYGYNSKDIMHVDLGKEAVVSTSDEGSFMAKERQAKPTVRVSLREMEGQEYLVCAVQGFYPNTIRVRWVYGGQIVYFGTTTTGLLPHRDGTFQMTSYLTLGNKTRQDIVCETEHISIEGKLQATLEDEYSNLGFLVGIAFMSFLMACLIPLGVTAIIVCMKKNRTQGSVNDSLSRSSDCDIPASVSLMNLEGAQSPVQ
ncbi:rano class II histocompatibility antigen, A beta chain isoform X2 [Clupea harengus]|uniref:Rano class II histocompatibility antigen, A beta chain isoform X2 n=1 Tax=Clupea harengus TaxID=7950 RepID=A0A6P8FGJ8_CLUHA|nr:rano class II histocompatibility antigen, A beta chain isoform X2 [Clupea harengus]